MKRPGMIVRLAGTPLVALLLLMACTAVVVGWCQEAVSGWLALAAALVATQTLSAVGQVRRYKAWAAMSEPVNPPPRQPQKTKRRWGRVAGAVVLALAIPAYWSSQIQPGEAPPGDALATAMAASWCVVCLYLVFRLMRGVVRLVAKRRKGNAEVVKAGPKDAPVAWLVGRPSSSPSRAEAERNLPEYCARLMGRG